MSMEKHYNNSNKIILSEMNRIFRLYLSSLVFNKSYLHTTLAFMQDTHERTEIAKNPPWRSAYREIKY